MDQQLYFCIGAAKTGTTILARLLDQQPSVGCMWEAYFFQPNHNASVLNPDGQGWVKHGLGRSDVERWHELATCETDGTEPLADPSTVRSLVTDVFARFADVVGAKVVGDKWPFYARRLELMLEAFPDAKYVYNVRDPRGVWNSGQTFRERERGDVILDDMLRVDDIVRPHLDDERFSVVRYEDLIAEPESELSKLGAFLGFRFDPEALEYVAADDPLPDRWGWVAPARGDLNAELTVKWRNEMPEEQQARVAEKTRAFMDRYSYST